MRGRRGCLRDTLRRWPCLHSGIWRNHLHEVAALPRPGSSRRAALPHSDSSLAGPGPGAAWCGSIWTHTDDEKQAAIATIAALKQTFPGCRQAAGVLALPTPSRLLAGVTNRKSEMIISRKTEKFYSLDFPRSVLKDTGWSDVTDLLSQMNICTESINGFCTEGPPHRLQGGMRDIGLHFGGWGFGLHEDPSDEPSADLVHDDSGGESASNRVDVSNSSAADEDGCFSSEDTAVPNVVSITVGLPRRFGNPACSDDDPESQVTEPTAAADRGASPECTVKRSLREILRKVTVNESELRTAIERLGGGVKGLKALIDYVKYFQDNQETNVKPDDFTRGLEQFCFLNGQAKTSSQNPGPNPPGPSTNESETHQVTGAGLDQNREAFPNMQIRGQDEWLRNNGHPGDPYGMGYMENMSGFFPNFCYPYPPPFAGYGPFNMGVRPMYMPMMGVPYFTPPSREYVHKTDAITRATRKSRIARRRVHGNDQHHARSMTKTAHVGGGTSQSGKQDNPAHQNAASTFSGQAMQGISTGDLMLILQKQLSPSGVSSLGRIVLPKKEAETHLPHLVASEGVLLNMTDFDTAQKWTFRYRFWSNNKSRMYLLENTRDFVKAHNLQERDMLSLYRDAEGSYVVRGEKSGTSQTGDGASDAVAEEDTPTEGEHSQKKQKF